MPKSQNIPDGIIDRYLTVEKCSGILVLTERLLYGQDSSWIKWNSLDPFLTMMNSYNLQKVALQVDQQPFLLQSRSGSFHQQHGATHLQFEHCGKVPHNNHHSNLYQGLQKDHMIIQFICLSCVICFAIYCLNQCVL